MVGRKQSIPSRVILDISPSLHTRGSPDGNIGLGGCPQPPKPDGSVTPEGSGTQAFILCVDGTNGGVHRCGGGSVGVAVVAFAEKKRPAPRTRVMIRLS